MRFFADEFDIVPTIVGLGVAVCYARKKTILAIS
jgi:hypothetical protein